MWGHCVGWEIPHILWPKLLPHLVRDVVLNYTKFWEDIRGVFKKVVD